MKGKNLCLLLILVSTLSCEKDEPTPIDKLEQFGILGKWKLENRMFNGISDLAVECCDFIEFRKDSLPDDFIGDFFSSGVGYETNGKFELDSSKETIKFDFSNRSLLYGYQIQDSVLAFSYEDGGQDIIENWMREG